MNPSSQKGERSRLSRGTKMLEELTGQVVVIDLKGSYVCLGTLCRFDDAFLELSDADLHDLRDTTTSRENYVAASQTTGLKRNRRKLLLARAEVVAISRLPDVVDE